MFGYPLLLTAGNRSHRRVMIDVYVKKAFEQVLKVINPLEKNITLNSSLIISSSTEAEIQNFCRDKLGLFITSAARFYLVSITTICIRNNCQF